MPGLGTILTILEKIIKLEGQAEEIIASEKDVKKREKYEKAFKDRDVAAIRDYLFNLF